MFIDRSVYTRNRSFRLFLSSKAGKEAVLMPTSASTDFSNISLCIRDYDKACGLKCVWLCITPEYLRSMCTRTPPILLQNQINYFLLYFSVHLFYIIA